MTKEELIRRITDANSAYRSSDGKLKAVIMRKHHGNSWDNCNPYDEVKLTKLRPTTEDFNKVFAE